MDVAVEKVLVFVRGDNVVLYVDGKGVPQQEIHSQDRFLDVSDGERPGELLDAKLQGQHLRAVAFDPSPAGTYKVVSD